MLNVLIADDNVPVSVQISNMINTETVRCIGILNNGSKVYQRLKELNPDVLILDLKMPGKNGLEILQEIQSDKSLKTKVFIYSGEMDYLALVRNYDCIEKYYSKLTPIQEIVRDLEMMVEKKENKTTGDKVIDILFKLGFSYSLKGTKLINDCILYSIVQNEDNLRKIYDEIAKTKGEKASTLKADINTAVNNMWRFADDKNEIRKFLHLGNYEKPSCKSVITMVKYYVNS